MVCVFTEDDDLSLTGMKDKVVEVLLENGKIIEAIEFENRVEQLRSELVGSIREYMQVEFV
jgi:hypothetical protein